MPRSSLRPVTHPAALAARTGDEDREGKKTAVPIMPAWVSLGDYDNIFSYHKLAIRGDVKPSSMGHLAANHDIFAPSTSGKPRKPAEARACFVKAKVKEILGGRAAPPPTMRKHYQRKYHQRVHEAEAKSAAAWAAAPAEEKAPFEAAEAAALAEYATALAAWQEQQKVAQLEMESKFLGQVGKVVNIGDVDELNEKLSSEDGDGVCMGLRFCLSPSKTWSSDVHLNQQALLFEGRVWPESVVFLPGGNDYAGGEAPSADDANANAPAPLFHLDSSGKACFSAAEAKTASAPPQHIYTHTAPSGHATVCLCLAPDGGCNRTTGVRSHGYGSD